jgi:hypothetical protein
LLKVEGCAAGRIQRDERFQQSTFNPNIHIQHSAFIVQHYSAHPFFAQKRGFRFHNRKWSVPFLEMEVPFLEMKPPQQEMERSAS